MKKKTNSLKDRLKKSYESKDKGSGTRPSVMDWKKIDGVKFYKPKEGRNKLNIIPYIIKTKNDPLVKTNDAKVGEQSYMLDAYIHNNIGPSQAQVFCLREMFGKPCSICEQRQQYYNEGKKDEAAALKAKRICFYNVQDLKNDSNEIQVWQVSHFLFEKELIEEAFASGEDNEPIDFVDIDDGKSVSFRAAETDSVINGKTVKFLEFKSFNFPERDDPLDESWIKKAVSFDELMKYHTYEEAKNLLYGEDEDEDEDKLIKKSKNKKKEIVEDEDDEEEEDIDEDDDEEDDDEDDKEIIEDDDEEEEEPEPVKPQKKNKKSSDKCPSGHKFGKDCDKYEDDCDECDIWTNCKKENKLQSKKKK
jgi:hypothetical protein